MWIHIFCPERVCFQENWRRPDGMPATREHLMMVLADLDDVLIRASYSTEMRSSSISDISMEVAVPNYSGLAQALEVEQCRCPPGYQGLSCQVLCLLWFKPSAAIVISKKSSKHLKLLEINVEKKKKLSLI